MSITALRWVKDESDPMAVLLATVQGMPEPKKLQACEGHVWFDVPFYDPTDSTVDKPPSVTN